MIESIKNMLRQYPALFNFFRKLKRNPIFKASYKKEVTGKNNSVIIDDSALFENCKFDIAGNDNQIVIEASTFFKNVTFFIRGNNNKIFISKEVAFHQGASLFVEDENCEINIGENTTFENIHMAATESKSKITIGRDCMFSYDIDLRTGDSHSLIDLATQKRINYAGDIKIDNHVWVAAHVSILKGANILKNSIVATRSVVTKSFDKAGILIGGTPARILKDNITWNRKRLYVE